VTLDHHGLRPLTSPAEPERARDQQRLAQWWSRLSASARSAFSADPDAPIAAEFLDQVMVGGVRIVGHLSGGQSMQWRFASETRDFIAGQGHSATH
jgi:hypothetical protein